MSAVKEIKSILESAGYVVRDEKFNPTKMEGTSPVLLIWGPKQNKDSQASGHLTEVVKVLIEVLSPKKDFWTGLEHLENHRYRILAVMRKADRSRRLSGAEYRSAQEYHTGNQLCPAAMLMEFSVKITTEINNIPTIEECDNV